MSALVVRIRRNARWLLALAAAIGLALAIATWVRQRATSIPMHVIRDLSGCAATASTLVVMLPGVRSPPEEFVQEGYVAALRQRSLAVDVAMVDSHLGYFIEGNVVRRLREDVVLPARAAGYRSIWLVGISLGGFGALGYAAKHGDDIDGVLAIAPYPGTQALLREITEAGGPLAWRRRAGDAAQPELERSIWWWLADSGASRKLPIYLGHGRDDSFAQGLELMAGTVPPGHASTVPGGHDWPPWRAVWNGWLERGLLGTPCAGAGAGKL